MTMAMLLKIRHTLLGLAVPLILGALAACAPAVPTTSATAPPEPTPVFAAATPASESLTREDAQGDVTFTVTPLNLDAGGPTLDFGVAMSTHSVDLAWDLAGQSTLTTSEGVTVTGQAWPKGTGHHVEGTLSFPAKTPTGQPVWTGSGTLTLTITQTDVAERVFLWSLPP